MRWLGSLICLLAPTAPTLAQPLSVSGVTGYLSEWQISGDLAPSATQPSEFSGTLKMTHVGLCSQAGPEVKSADVRFQIVGSHPPRQLRATLTMDGATCSFGGAVSDSYKGSMDCANAKGLPIALSLK